MLREPVETFRHAGKTVKIFTDENPENPREWDNLGTMRCWHRTYNLGDPGEKLCDDAPPEFQDFSAWAWAQSAIYIPLGLLDHSGLTMYEGSGAHLCDPGGWDSGPIGFLYVLPATVRKEYGVSRITKKVRERALACLRAELETYDQYLRGEVYGYTVEAPDGTELDSCWGMMPLDYCQEEARRAAESETIDLPACP